MDALMPCNKTLTKVLFLMLFAVVSTVAYVAPFDPIWVMVSIYTLYFLGVPYYIISAKMKKWFSDLLFDFVVIVPSSLLWPTLLKLDGEGNQMIAGVFFGLVIGYILFFSGIRKPPSNT